jgi:hypothetical protein
MPTTQNAGSKRRKFAVRAQPDTWSSIDACEPKRVCGTRDH